MTHTNPRRTKIPLYARVAIREVWLVELADDAITVHRDPFADGYRTLRTLRRGVSASTLAFHGRELVVAEILG